MNPDQALIRRFRATDGPLAIDSNPLGKALRARLIAVDRQAGRVKLAFEPGSDFLQGRGVVQGGVVSAILDFAAAFAALSVLPDGAGAATASMAITFQSAVQVGPLVAIGTVERAGRRLVFARAELRTADDAPLLATASAVMSVLDSAS